MTPQTRYQIAPIAVAHTPFDEKFAIPRQPGLASAATGIIELLPPFDDPQALQGLEDISHIWVHFLFHQALPDPDQPPKLRVRPPRLGGNTKMGVFATRSSHRPNGIGQSLLQIEKIEQHRIHVSGLDLLDQTPVIDIKPYLPYAENLPHAYNHMADSPPRTLEVQWEALAFSTASEWQLAHAKPLVDLIEQCLAQDPRPAYQNPTPDRRYGTRFWGVEVGWQYIDQDTIRVTRITASHY